MAIAQIVFIVVRELNAHVGPNPWWAMYFAVALLAAFGMTFFVRRAGALHREAAASRLDQPSGPPDFESLGDGSQRYENLRQIHE